MKAAIQELMDDHQVILRMLGVLQGLCARLDKGGRVDFADLDAAIDFIKAFADHCHHGKEEDLLFPAMEGAGFPRDGGPIGVMLMEHARGREFVKALSNATARLKAGESAAAKEVAGAARGYVELLVGHIHKEDNILYPMALDALPDPAWKTMEKDFARVESERMGPKKRAAFIALVERLAAAYPGELPAVPDGPLCH